MLDQAGFRVHTPGLKEVDTGLKRLQEALRSLVKQPSKSITELYQRNQWKAKQVIMQFSMDTARILSENTKIGDLEKITRGEGAPIRSKEGKYYRLYKVRQELYGLPMTPGYHAGAYSYSETTQPLVPEIRTRDQMMSELKSDFITQYQLGDTFTISAQGPAYPYMKSGEVGAAPLYSALSIESLIATYKLAAESFK